jgi:ApeA N-terminal domain 1
LSQAALIRWYHFLRTAQEGGVTILEDRGLFWWNNQVVPKEQFAPNDCVHGKVTISDDGQVRLDLDTVMPGQRAWDNLRNVNKPAEHNIQGLLSAKSEKVLLLGLIQAGGGFRSNNLTPASYLATNCLVSERRFRPDAAAPLVFRNISVGLDGLEDWLWLRNIKTDLRRGPRLTAKYKRPAPLRYDLSLGALSIEYDMIAPWRGKSADNKLNLVETATINLKLKEKMTLEDSQTFFQRIEELILLLTSYDRSLDWPTIILAKGGQHAKNYFFRSRVEAKPPSAHECLINFPKIAFSFGNLFAALVSKREEFGPGFYLYLGTRRGMKMFLEHRFVNLIWGLEAFDRRGRSEGGTPLDEKVARILDDVVNARDKRWLRRQLRHAAEPRLAQRLCDVFRSIPLDYDYEALQRFCEECERRRNDISHWGGLRPADQDYQAFMRDIDTKADALSALYHLHLLVVIGIDCERLNFVTNHSWPLSRMEMDLRNVGILKPKPPTPDPTQVVQNAAPEKDVDGPAVA